MGCAVSGGSGGGGGPGGGGGGAKGEGSWSLGTLPFRVLARLLHAAPPDTDDGRTLRAALLRLGLVRLLLACLAVFTHHKPASNDVSITLFKCFGGRFSSPR